MGVDHSVQHFCSLVDAVLYMARLISQHFLVDDAENPQLCYYPRLYKSPIVFAETKKRLRMVNPICTFSEANKKLRGKPAP